MRRDSAGLGNGCKDSARGEFALGLWVTSAPEFLVTDPPGTASFPGSFEKKEGRGCVYESGFTYKPMKFKSVLLQALAMLVCMFQSGCAVSSTQRLAVSDITVRSGWRPLFDANLQAAVEAAIIRHFADSADGPKVTSVTGGGWVVLKRTEDEIVVQGHTRLVYKQHVQVPFLYESRSNKVVDLGFRTLSIRFAPQ